jgi:ADP-ribosylarginine hydrolase
LAVAESLIETHNLKPSNNEVYFNLIDHYKRAMKDMKDRAPGIVSLFIKKESINWLILIHFKGNTCISTISSLSKRQPFGFRIPFNPRGGGCGASMR